MADGIIKYAVRDGGWRNVAIHVIVVRRWIAIHSRIGDVFWEVSLPSLWVGLHAFLILFCLYVYIV